MTLKKYLIMMIISTLLAWAALAMVLIKVNPWETNFLGFSLFYISFFLALVGTLSLLGFLARTVFLKNDLIFRQVSLSFRQAISLAVIFLGGLFLQSKGLLSWWNTLILILALVILEFFIISYRRRA